MRGYITVSSTACTICTAFLLWRYKPVIIKVRGELAHTLLQFGKSVGQTIRRTHKAVTEDAWSLSEKVRPRAGGLEAVTHTLYLLCAVHLCTSRVFSLHSCLLAEGACLA